MTEFTNPCDKCDDHSCESIYNEDGECWQTGQTILRLMANGATKVLRALTGIDLENQSDHHDVG